MRHFILRQLSMAGDYNDPDSGLILKHPSLRASLAKPKVSDATVFKRRIVRFAMETKQSPSVIIKGRLALRICACGEHVSPSQQSSKHSTSLDGQNAQRDFQFGKRLFQLRVTVGANSVSQGGQEMACVGNLPGCLDGPNLVRLRFFRF